MTSPFPKRRPTCQEVLEDIEFSFMNDEEINLEKEIEKLISSGKSESVNNLEGDTIFKKSILNGKYNESFQTISVIGFGTYGIVCKARSLTNNSLYAIKKVPLINYKYPTREWSFMKNFRNDYLVNFITGWTERNYIKKDYLETVCDVEISSDHVIFQTENKLILHIQMELCDTTLKEFISRINQELKQNSNFQTPIGFYISCEIFKEILEAVNYLHKQKKPVIHRDLKPANILIKCRKNGRFVKIGDFGLVKVQESINQSNTKYVGTRKYMAPEVYEKCKYNTKADLYSIGALSQVLFNIDMNDRR
jgi:serine/threonine protein kinase